MAPDEIQLDGDPRTIAKAVLRAANETYRGQHGRLGNWDDMRAFLESEVPKLAKQMVDAFENDVRDVYLMNALEIMTLSYAKRTLRDRD